MDSREKAQFAQIWQEICDGAQASTGFDCSRFRSAAVRLNGSRSSIQSVAAQNPYLLKLPGLTEKPWWRSEDFDPRLQAYLKTFEDNYEELLEEFYSGLDLIKFTPAKTGYYGESQAWQTFLFYDNYAEPNPVAAASFPKTFRQIERLHAENFIVKAHYSVLKAQSKLELHCGSINNELRMHFGLNIPAGDIRINVGGQVDSWENGKWRFFDDTFPHEVWNNTDEDRHIIHFRVLHPDLSEEERQLSYVIIKALNRLDPRLWAL